MGDPVWGRMNTAGRHSQQLRTTKMRFDSRAEPIHLGNLSKEVAGNDISALVFPSQVGALSQ